MATSDTKISVSSNSSSLYDFLFKIVIIGDSGVGKTQLLSRYIDNNFDSQSKATIGVEFASKTEVVNGQRVKSQIWDTAGQERFRSLTNAYYRGASGALLVYDITKHQSFSNCVRWLKELSQYADPNLVIVLVGNKSDMEEQRAVSVDEGIKLSEEHKLLFVESSAKQGSNVQVAFSQLVSKIYGNVHDSLTLSIDNIDTYKMKNRILDDSKETIELKREKRNSKKKVEECCQVS